MSLSLHPISWYMVFDLFHGWSLDHLLKVVSASVLVSCGCVPIAINWGLKTTEMYSLTVLEARSQNQGLDRATPPLKMLGKNPFLASSSFWWLLAIPWFVAASLWSLSLSLSSRRFLLRLQGHFSLNLVSL